jgi:hypothetical protein
MRCQQHTFKMPVLFSILTFTLLKHVGLTQRKDACRINTY